MDFELSDDQVALQEAVRAFCESRCGSEAIHELADAGGPTRQLWQELAEMGVFGLCVPEEQGGAGLGWVEAMVVFEELGRSLVPGPLAATFLAAQHLPEAANGEAAVTMLDAEARPVMVEHPDFADLLAVIEDETVRVVDWLGDDSQDGVQGDPNGAQADLQDDSNSAKVANEDSTRRQDSATPVDPLTPVARLAEDRFEALQQTAILLSDLSGADGNMEEAGSSSSQSSVLRSQGSEDISSSNGWLSPAALWRLRGAALVAAQQLGIAAGATASAVAYAQERKQFDKPIGQFQAVKHLCSDMLTSVEVARAAVYYAGALLDDPSFGDAQRAVSAARLMASEAANLCGRNCVQIHGGMGYTWEMDAHLYLKRAWVLDMTLSPPEEHAEIMATSLS